MNTETKWDNVGTSEDSYNDVMTAKDKRDWEGGARDVLQFAWFE